MSQQPNGTIHRVVFVSDRGQPVAAPGRLVVSTGDEIIFRSVDVGPVSLQFPAGILADLSGKEVTAIDIPGSGLEVQLVFRRGEQRHPGLYSYAAFCRGRGLDDAALGGSQPKIIIYQ